MAYLYRHIRLDKNEPFYIGIGSDNVYKRANDKKGRNKIWYDIAAKTDYEVEILFDNISWDNACKKEIEFISLYGKKAKCIIKIVPQEEKCKTLQIDKKCIKTRL